jgi:hypothetical protein
MRSNYWSCSTFADWIRGTTKLTVGTAEEWNEWEDRAKSAYPIRWLIAEEGLNYIQKFVYYIPDKLNDIRYYINNRWITRSHTLTAHPRDIRPGDWCDVGDRVLPCLFNALVDFVEIEQAWCYVCWDKKEQKKYNVPWWRSGWSHWRGWRCPAAGIAYLDWAASLTNADYKQDDEPEELTHHARAAAELKELYLWWTETYRNRPDPYDASGWTAYCENSREQHGGKFSIFLAHKTPDMQEMSKTALAKLQEIESAYEAEDEAMMVRLIKLRKSLWA